MTKKKAVIMGLKRGEVAVIPTDTLYGLVGNALSRKAVEHIYRLRRRPRGKPMIILIGRMADLILFGIQPDPRTKKILRHHWPGPVSVILDCPTAKFKYLHRGTRTLAFRLPAKRSLRDLLRQTGPLVAPSANPTGAPPARTLAEARRYFGEQIKFYYGRGRRTGPPSRLIRIIEGRPVTLR